MKKTLLLLFFTLYALSIPAKSADLSNGANINKSCALCHGLYGQGATGTLSPRIAGMPKDYLIKAIKDYRDGVRNYELMVKTSGLKNMSEQDIEDVASYISMLDLSSDKEFDIQAISGNIEEGEKGYRDCNSCHGTDGYGKPRKGAPPLAGQHQAYIYTIMSHFRAKSRFHDNDPDDDSFDDYEEQELMDISAYLTTLDDKKGVDGYKFVAPVLQASRKTTPEQKAGIIITDIQQTVVRIKMREGITVEEATAAMNSMAIEKNMKLVGEQHVSKELESRGIDSPYLAIFQYCNPVDALTMITVNPVFASYMPCRVSVVEDQEGDIWFMMLNLDMLINNKLIDDRASETAMKVNQHMLDIMMAGATGEF